MNYKFDDYDELIKSAISEDQSHIVNDNIGSDNTDDDNPDYKNTFNGLL